jgi:hypothetical protein
VIKINAMTKKTGITHFVSTKITDNDFKRITAYGAQKGISLYETVRELLLYGLSVKEKGSGDVSARLEALKEEIKQELERAVETIPERCSALSEGTRSDVQDRVVVPYLQQILYHSFRADIWNSEYVKKVNTPHLAHELDQIVEGLVKKHSA